MKGWHHQWDKRIMGKRDFERESSCFVFVSVFSVAVGYSFLSRISHIFFPKITQNCVGVCYSEQMLAGVEAPKTSPINKDSCFLSPSPCDEEAPSAGVGENLCRYQHLVAILIHWSIMKLQEWLAMNAVQDCHMLFHNHVESFTELSCHSVL